MENKYEINTLGYALMKELPRISVITPSFNQGGFIEKTICSVLDQAYPNLEYFVVDGGSTDASVDILRKYDRQISWWVSESDRGQSHAINKGFARASGDILCWLNSDDFFEMGALHVVARLLANGSGQSVVAGHCVRHRSDGSQPELLRGHADSHWKLLQYWRPYTLHQPSIFWRREVYEKIGPLNEDLDLVMDYDYWLRITRHFQIHDVDSVLSHCMYHAAAKTADNYQGYHRERRHLALKTARASPSIRYLMFCFRAAVVELKAAVRKNVIALLRNKNL